MSHGSIHIDAAEKLTWACPQPEGRHSFCIGATGADFRVVVTGTPSDFEAMADELQVAAAVARAKDADARQERLDVLVPCTITVEGFDSPNVLDERPFGSFRHVEDDSDTVPGDDFMDPTVF